MPLMDSTTVHEGHSSKGTMSESPSESSSALTLLLDTVRRAQQRGETTRARAVARMLTQQYPGSLAAWQALADLAEDAAEQQLALTQIRSLSPAIEPAWEAPAKAAVFYDEPAIGNTTPVELTSSSILEVRASRMRWPILLVSGIAAAVIIGLLLWRLGVFAPRTAVVVETTPISPPIATIATLIPTERTDSADLPTAAPLPTTDAEATSEALPTAAPSATPVPTIGPSPTPRPILAVGTVIEQDIWSISLLRPEHALVLDGSIGNLQPRGRFVLALLAIANGGTTAARLPHGMVTLVDAAGHVYSPSVDASVTYLNTYGRGQVGDLSLSEGIPPNAGNVSVPLIFDIPADARDLYLVVAGATQGWPVPGR